MRPLPPDATSELTVLVTEAMTVQFEELGPVHPVYATYWIAKHMEEASRKLLLPYIETDEEGIGQLVETDHVSPALVGMTIAILARLDAPRSHGRRVACGCEAWSELGDLVARGRTVQYVLRRASLDERFRVLANRWDAARANGASVPSGHPPPLQLRDSRAG